MIGTLLPAPPPPGHRRRAVRGAGRDHDHPLNGQQQIVILAVTAQDAEVLKFAQMDGNISLVLRSPRDCTTKPVDGGTYCPVVATTGITLRRLVDDRGVLPPTVVQVIQPTPLPGHASPAQRSPSRSPTAASSRSAGDQPADRATPAPEPPPAPPRPLRSDPQDMADQIRVLIVDDIPETRDHLAKLLGFETDIVVVGAAASGREALEMAAQLTPDVVLMDINMPDMDGIAATERLSAEVPTAAVVMMSVQGEADYLRRSMLAGAREFLVKPFSSDELTSSIRQVYTREREKLSRIAVQPAAPSSGTAAAKPAVVPVREDAEPGRIVAVFGPKGGVGRTTLAVNLAVAAATELGQRTCLVDASFQFGDVGVLLNLNPKNKSIADLIPELEAGEPESLDTFLINHSAGIRVLLAPPSPEMAELITPPGVKRMLEALRATHDLVIVDCMSSFNDTTIAILDLADTVLTMLSLEITSIKNIRLFLEVADQLGYGSDKIRLVLNRADSSLGIRVADVEHSIGRRVDHTIVSDGRSVVYALNRGVPFFLSNREAQVSQDVLRLASAVAGTNPAGGRRAGQEERTEEVAVRMAMTWQRRSGRHVAEGV